MLSGFSEEINHIFFLYIIHVIQPLQIISSAFTSCGHLLFLFIVCSPQGDFKIQDI